MKKNEEEKSLDEKNLKWRLSSKPTREDVIIMLDKQIITKEEARQMLFSEESTNEKIQALEEQVTFLKSVIEKLPNQAPATVIKYIHDYTPRITYVNGGNPWNGIKVLCSTSASGTSGGSYSLSSGVGGVING